LTADQDCHCSDWVWCVCAE